MNKEIIKTIESNWDYFGACCSCGWHGAFYESDIDDQDIIELLNDGRLELPCVNKDDPEGRFEHRGIRIYLKDIFEKNPKLDKTKKQ